jgi:peptidoglycan hydrolase CwlO-like protein
MKKLEWISPINLKLITQRNYFLFKLMSPIHRDLLKITLLDEDNLKQHILEELKKLNNKQDIEALNAWVTKIDKNKAQAKDYFQKLNAYLTEIPEFIEDAKSIYQNISKTYATIEQMQQRFDLLDKEIKELEPVRAKKAKETDIFKVLTILAIFGLVPLILASTAILLVAYLVPAFFLVTVGSVLLLGVGLLITTFCIPDSVFDETLDNLFDKTLHDLDEQIQDMEYEQVNLQDDLKFMKQFPQWNEKFVPQFANAKNYASELDAVIKELSDLEPQVAPVQSSGPWALKTNSNVSSVSMFSNKKQAVEVPSSSNTMSPY